jgi:hypothetical protein
MRRRAARSSGTRTAGCTGMQPAVKAHPTAASAAASGSHTLASSGKPWSRRTVSRASAGAGPAISAHNLCFPACNQPIAVSNTHYTRFLLRYEGRLGSGQRAGAPHPRTPGVNELLPGCWTAPHTLPPPARARAGHIPVPSWPAPLSVVDDGGMRLLLHATKRTIIDGHSAARTSSQWRSLLPGGRRCLPEEKAPTGNCLEAAPLTGAAAHARGTLLGVALQQCLRAAAAIIQPFVAGVEHVVCYRCTPCGRYAMRALRHAGATPCGRYAMRALRHAGATPCGSDSKGACAACTRDCRRRSGRPTPCAHPLQPTLQLPA